MSSKAAWTTATSYPHYKPYSQLRYKLLAAAILLASIGLWVVFALKSNAHSNRLSELSQTNCTLNSVIPLKNATCSKSSCETKAKTSCECAQVSLIFTPGNSSFHCMSEIDDVDLTKLAERDPSLFFFEADPFPCWFSPPPSHLISSTRTHTVEHMVDAASVGVSPCPSDGPFIILPPFYPGSSDASAWKIAAIVLLCASLPIGFCVGCFTRLMNSVHDSKHEELAQRVYCYGTETVVTLSEQKEALNGDWNLIYDDGPSGAEPGVVTLRLAGEDSTKIEGGGRDSSGTFSIEQGRCNDSFSHFHWREVNMKLSGLQIVNKFAAVKRSADKSIFLDGLYYNENTQRSGGFQMTPTGAPIFCDTNYESKIRDGLPTASGAEGVEMQAREGRPGAEREGDSGVEKAPLITRGKRKQSLRYYGSASLPLPPPDV